MAKLSHIDDFETEQKEQVVEHRAVQAAVAQAPQEPIVSSAQQTQVNTESHMQQVDSHVDTAISNADDKLAEDIDMTAQQEADFHGLDSTQPMGVGHKILIVAALVVVVAAILYIVNSWIHFI